MESCEFLEKILVGICTTTSIGCFMSSYNGGFPSSEPKHLKQSKTLASSTSNRSNASNNNNGKKNDNNSRDSTNKKRQYDGNVVTRSKQAKPTINLQTTNNRNTSSHDKEQQKHSQVFNENQAPTESSQYQDNNRSKVTTQRRASELNQSSLHKTPNTASVPSKESLKMQQRSATTNQSSAHKTPNITTVASRESNEFLVSRIACSEERNSVSEVSIDTLLDRVDRLEQIVLNIQSTVEKYKNVFARHNSSSEAIVKLDQYHCNLIKEIVQNEMFKSVKFIDNHALLNIGDELVKRVLIMSNANPNKISDRPFYNAVISRSRLAMSTHKCHIKSKIRNKTSGKSVFHLLEYHHLC